MSDTLNTHRVRPDALDIAATCASCPYLIGGNTCFRYRHLKPDAEGNIPYAYIEHPELTARCKEGAE